MASNWIIDIVEKLLLKKVHYERRKFVEIGIPKGAGK
jgi:hypothetical protein